MAQKLPTKVLPVHTFGFISVDTGKPIAEIHFNAGEAFIEKKSPESEKLIVNSQFKADWVKFLCYSVDYDCNDAFSSMADFRRGDWKGICLIAFNANRYNLRICINGLPMYSEELQSKYTEFSR